MQEIAEFRIDEDFAARLFAEEEGVKLGIARKIEIAVDDPRFSRIGELQREVTANANRAFFYGWRIKRTYASEELEKARSLRLVVESTFEPPGESCGTRYDDSKACPKCGSGAPQVSDLWLDLRKAPKGKDIARTIADEWIVSQRLAEGLIEAGLTGFELRLVRHRALYKEDPLDLREIPTGQEIIRKAEAAGAPYQSGRFDVWLNRAENRPLLARAQEEYASLKGKESKWPGKAQPVWYQMIVNSATAEIVPPTRTGINPFDDDARGECRCPLGDLLGLNLLSEVSISAASRGDADVVQTRQFIGVRGGLLRPTRVVIISPRFWRFLRNARVAGIGLEVVHLL